MGAASKSQAVGVPEWNGTRSPRLAPPGHYRLLCVLASRELDGAVSSLTVDVTLPSPRDTVDIHFVNIDIKPGSDHNSINPKSKGKIPVAILSTPTFNAPAEVDTTSLTFGRTGDEPSLAFCNASAEEVNGDGLLDLICHFNTQQTGFQAADTQGVLKGTTVDGTYITWTDSVRIVP